MAEQKAVATPKINMNSLLERDELLVMFGFVKEKYKREWDEKFGPLSEAKRRLEVKRLGDKVQEWALLEVTETTDGAFSATGFPGNAGRYHLVLETSADNVEETYFDVLERVRQHFGFPVVHKVSDYFAASENSAFFGNSQQRIGLQQDRVQQFLANIGKFVKELFQMVRELRAIDERLDMYRAADGIVMEEVEGKLVEVKKNKPSQAANVSLKSVFTDVVEGGTKNPASVFGLASQVNFTLLPDLFFNTYIEKPEDVDEAVEKLQYNVSVKAVLKRKLHQFAVWKKHTYSELKSKRTFNVRYLRQHWTIIKMYMSWVKPYLRNIQRLTMNPKFMESPDIIAAFETSYIEVEFLAIKPDPKPNSYQQCVLGTFYFRTRPDMSVRKEYQQGPNHLGRMDMNLRGYAWTAAQVDAYRKMKQREEIELLGILDSSLPDIMDALGEDFEKYLTEVGEEIIKDETPKKEEPKLEGALSPFIGIFVGFKEIFEGLLPMDLIKPDKKKAARPGKPDAVYIKACGAASQIYHTYKKAHKMITW